MAQPAVFVDRDGTLIEDADYLSSSDEIRILPGSIPGLRRLHEAGYLIVIVTNQSGVARGLISEDQLATIHEKLIEQVETLGGTIDAIYYCPHHPEEGRGEYRRQCDCRKPLPGLLYQARDELGIDLGRSYLVGDAWRDAEAALAAGVPPIMVPRPVGREEQGRDDVYVMAYAANLAEAAEAILSADAEAVRRQMNEAMQHVGGGVVDACDVAPCESPDEDAFDNPPATVGGRAAVPVTPIVNTGARGTRVGRVVAAPVASSSSSAKVGAVGDSGDTLGQILIELKRLRRQRDVEGFNFSRTVGFIMQIVAIGLGAISPFSTDGSRMLMMILAAILVQLIALTMFIISRE